MVTAVHFHSRSLLSIQAEPGGFFLVRVPGGNTVLINAGPDASVLRTLGEQLPPWKRRLEAVVLTEPTSLAAGGLPQVFERYAIGSFVRTPVTGSRTLESALGSAGPAPSILYRGDRFRLGNAYLEALWPPRTPTLPRGENGYAVVRITYGTVSFRIGALPERAEKWRAAVDGEEETIVLSSSTPPSEYVTDGLSVWKK